MEIRLLIVSDTHEGYNNLIDIVARESENIDIIVHCGDFGNMQAEEKHLQEVQEEGREIYLRTINFLKQAGKPIVSIPGNVRIYLA